MQPSLASTGSNWRLKLRTMFFALLSIWFSQLAMPAHAEKNKSDTADLTLYVEIIPPYVYFQNGDLTGINYQLVERLCQLEGLACNFREAPWARAYDQARKQPRTGVFSTARTADREYQFRWVGPLVNAESYLYRLARANHVDLLNRVPGVNYRVGYVRGSAMVGEIMATGLVVQEELIPFASIEESIRMLVLGKVDLTPLADLSSIYYLEQQGLPPGHVVPASPGLRRDRGNFIALHPATPASLVTGLNVRLAQIKQSKWMRSLRRHYYRED